MFEIYRHEKSGGLYSVISKHAINENDLASVVIYQALRDGTIWVRPYSEFFDGRFVKLGAMEMDATDYMADIAAFHEKFELNYSGMPRSLPDELAQFRGKFMQEETSEWLDSVAAVKHQIEHGIKDPAEYAYQLAKQLDALVDLVYVALGTAYLQGFGPIFNEAWTRVHDANMQKVRASSASDSKRGSSFDVVKPDGWEPPSHSDLVELNDRNTI